MVSKYTSDITLYVFFSIKDFFSDLFNGCLFDGKSIIKAKDLYAYDSNLATVVEKGNQSIPVKRQKDLIFVWNYKGIRILLGLENQKNGDKVMVLRVYNYQALIYNHQLRLLQGKHMKMQELMASGSLVINWGEHRWKGPFDVHGLFNLPKEIIDSGLVPNYQMLVRQLVDLDYKLFKEKEVRDFIKVTQLIYKIKKNPQEVGKLLVSKRVALLIESLVDEKNEGLKKIILEQEGETVDMCESLDRMMNSAKSEGRMEGRVEGRMQGRIEGKMEGKIEGVLEQTKRLFNRYYPGADDSFLNGLTSETYTLILDMMFERQSVDKIKQAVFLN